LPRLATRLRSILRRSIGGYRFGTRVCRAQEDPIQAPTTHAAACCSDWWKGCWGVPWLPPMGSIPPNGLAQPEIGHAIQTTLTLRGVLDIIEEPSHRQVRTTTQGNAGKLLAF
jgi:hypothetical protein